MANYQPSETPDNSVTRPDAIGVLAKLLVHHSKKGRRKPKMFPSDPREAAQFWINHQRPADDYSEPMTPITQNYEVVGYNTPYHDRVLKTLRVFLGMQEIHQVFIIDCIDKGMEYRGEDMKIYTEIAKQYPIMWDDPEKYKAEASKQLRAFQ